MKKENFELFLGCLGNGITVCNKSVEENGAYKTIAHIAECGKITWYVNPVRYEFKRRTLAENQLFKTGML